MWHVLTGEPKLVREVFAHLLEVLTLSLPYQEKMKSNRTLRIETDIPKAVRSKMVTTLDSWDDCFPFFNYTHTVARRPMRSVYCVRWRRWG